MSTLALITFFSISSIIYEFYEDKNNVYINLMNDSLRAQYEYENYKDLKYSNKYLFALYLLYYKYSFFNIFSTYNYNHPRYIRFFIEIIKILLNFLLSIIPFYYKFPKEEFNNSNFSFYYAFNSFLYSIIGSIIILFISQIIYKIFEFKNIRRLIWKQKKDILKEYVFSYFKKEAIFNKKLKPVRKKIIAYVNLCGKKILENKKKDKYLAYLEYKFNQQNSNIQISEFDYEDSLIIKNNISLNNLIYNNQLPSLKESLLKKTKTKLEKSYLNNNNDVNIKSNTTEKLIISKGVKPFTLSPKTKNNISMENIYRLESIRNKYIFKYPQNLKYNIENDSKIIKYCDLYIETQKNYSYIFSNDILFNQLETTYSKPKLITIKLINSILLISLLIIDIFIIIVFNKVYEKYDNFIIISWLIPVLIQILIFNFFINYMFSLLASILLFSNYKKRNNNLFSKCLFIIFVEKYMRNLFKMRNLINKYYPEFDNLK